MSKFDLFVGNGINAVPIQCQSSLSMPNALKFILSYTDHCDGGLPLIIKELNNGATATYSNVNQIRIHDGRIRLVYHDKQAVCRKLNDLRLMSKELIVDCADIHGHYQYGRLIDRSRSHAIIACTIYEHALFFQTKSALGVNI